MIKIVEEEQKERLFEYCKGSALGCRIAASVKAYGLDKPFAQFWFMFDEKKPERITAVISRLDDGMTICANGEYNYEEADAFVSMMNGEIKAVRPARPGEPATGIIMRMRDPQKSFERSANMQLNPAIEDLYAVMERCTGRGYDIPDFESFYSDMIYRQYNNCVISVIVRDGEQPAACVAAHLSDDCALLTLCATAPKYRGKGFASYAINAILPNLGDRQVYAMCFLGLEEFYEHLGFVPVGGFVC